MSKLFLVPNYISGEQQNAQLPPFITEVIADVNYYIVENIRSARRFIKSVYPEKNIDNITFFELNKHTDQTRISSFLEPCENGNNTGLISEAGVPCVADPGAVIVSMAHTKNIHVIPMVGPSSILLALMGSGMNGQSFSFHGYLPIDKNERRKKIKELERGSQQQLMSQIFIETPYRNNQLMQELINTCDNNLKLCIAFELMTTKGFVVTRTISEWRKNIPELHKKTVVFVLGK